MSTWLMLDCMSHPALGLANQRRVNLKTHPGAFQGRSKYLLWGLG